MKIDIYTLLGMIKDGKAPKKIYYKNEIFEYDEKEKDYAHIDFNEYLFDVYLITDILNDEVEILDEPKEDKIEKIYHCETSLTENEVEIFITKNLNMMVDKINEIIDKLNKE